MYYNLYHPHEPKVNLGLIDSMNFTPILSVTVDMYVLYFLYQARTLAWKNVSSI